MAANTWASAGSTDGNAGANYDLNHVPTTGETFTLDGTSVVDCNIASTTIVCLDVNVATAYSGLITLSGSKSIQTASGGTSTIDGRISITSVYGYLYTYGSGSLSLGANAQISGVGYIYINGPTAGLTANAGASVTCDRILYNSPRVGSSLAAGTYDCDLQITGHVSNTSYRDFTFAAGSFSLEDVTLTSPGTVALQVDAGTNNPTITITGDWTIDSDSSGGITWSASSNAVVLGGDLIDEVIAGSFTADSQDITATGSSSRDWDGCGGTWGATIVNMSAGTLTLSGTWTCSSFTGTDGDFDLNGQTLTASGAVDLASGFTVADPAGATIECDTFAADGVDLIGSASWDLVTASSGTVANATITNCNATGGTIDATDNCVDGGGNSELVDFGDVTALGAWETPYAIGAYEAGAWR